MPLSPRRRLRRLLRAMRPLAAAPEAEAEGATASGEDRRPWEPPFDASAPAPPISYPITDLSALASRSYLSATANFHLPFNRASVPGTGEPLPPRRRLLVCHDMQGGYRDDAAPQGGDNPDAYALWHWHLIDVFVYFSHYLVTLPPPCWINAAHLHGVKVLGTFITEWDKGAEICKEMLATEATAQMYAERLSELAAELGFDGWLVNIEVKLDVQFIENLKVFVNHLATKMHAAVPGSLVIWYDAITISGDLDWQNKLNKYNKAFFDLCDGLFANYTWKKNDPQDSAEVAGNRKYDVYMGIDVFGRNTFGGGQWNTNVALDLIKKVDVSTAVFAPGWVYETKQSPDFESAQNRWWGLVENTWGILRSYPKKLPFYSDFNQGHGYQVSVEGLQVSRDPWNNISCQSFQPMLKYSGHESQLQAFTDFQGQPYSGGNCLTVKGSLQQNTILSEQLFNGALSMEVGSIDLFFSSLYWARITAPSLGSHTQITHTRLGLDEVEENEELKHFCSRAAVRANANSALGVSLDLSSRNKESTSILVAEDIAAFTRRKLNHKYDSYIKADKVESHAPYNQDWVLYRASVPSSIKYTLTGINIICTLKIAGEIGPEPELGGISLANVDRASPYHASLGSISIQKTGEGTQFPPAELWVTEGEYISWSNSSNTSTHLSMKISWKLKTPSETLFKNYNIYIEMLRADSAVKPPKNYLGAASVEAFYISNLEVPSGVTGLKFIIQACGPDGSCQEPDECPKLFLVPVDSEVHSAGWDVSSRELFQSWKEGLPVSSRTHLIRRRGPRYFLYTLCEYMLLRILRREEKLPYNWGCAGGNEVFFFLNPVKFGI